MFPLPAQYVLATHAGRERTGFFCTPQIPGQSSWVDCAGARWRLELAAHAKAPGILAITESENAPSRRTLERAAFVHADDTVMRFQGNQQTVSRYLWRRASEPAR